MTCLCMCMQHAHDMMLTRVRVAFHREHAALGTSAIPSPLWIFGYGSLCWKADFPAEEQFVGRVSGWKRLFAQRSTDHRGTPAAPGLVATVLTDEQLEVLKLRSPGGALKG